MPIKRGMRVRGKFKHAAQGPGVYGHSRVDSTVDAFTTGHQTVYEHDQEVFVALLRSKMKAQSEICDKKYRTCPIV